MDFETTQPEDLKGGGNYLREPGVYHFTITEVLDGCYASGKPINGGGLTLKLTTLTESQDGKSATITLHSPKLTSKDRGESSRKKQTAFLVATNLVAPCDLGKPCKVEPKNAVGLQIVAELELGEKQEGSDRQYLELKFWNIWHVDDPRVPQSALRQDALKATVYDQDNRRPADYFDPIVKAAKSSGGGSSSLSSSAPKRQAVTADDL